MSGFSVEWLNQREGADHRARDSILLANSISWLKDLQVDEPIIIDLGSGTGSTIRAMLPIIQQMFLPVKWRLVDDDPLVLSEAMRRHAGELTIEDCIADFSNIHKLPLEEVNLITTSALLDLVSADFITELTKQIKTMNKHRPVGLYSALNYDGSIKWLPDHPLDRAILDCFNQDQRRDKGFGPALGPAAGKFLQDQFTARDFQIFSAKSTWALGSPDTELINSLIRGITDVALQSDNLANSEVKDWGEFRIKNVASGTCHVSHVDLLATPQRNS